MLKNRQLVEVTLLNPVSVRMDIKWRAWESYLFVMNILVFQEELEHNLPLWMGYGESLNGTSVSKKLTLVSGIIIN